MATTKVSDLSALTTTDGAEELLVNDGGTSKKVTIANLLHDNSIDSDHYVDGSIDTAHFSADCITADEIGDNIIDSEHYAAGSIDLEHMSSESVDEDNLYISNAGSNGEFLSKQSGNDGGLTWATPTDTDTTYTAGDFKLDDLGTPDDNTDLDFSTTRHGLVPKGTNTGAFLEDDGSWGTPTDTNTTYSAGTALDLSTTTFNVDLSELSTSTSDGDGDYFVVTDAAGAQYKLTKANIALSGMNNDSSWTANTGTMTDVVNDTTPQLGGDLDCNGSQIQWSQGADVASTGALPVLTDGNYFDVTGTTAITSINTTGGVGTLIKLHFDGALTLTHHATDLILPSGANITTAAGDEAEFIEYAAGDYRCTNYSKASGEAVVGASGVTLGFFEHTHTISSDLTISTDYKALSAGPITVDTGYSVTVPSGSTWVIV